MTNQNNFYQKLDYTYPEMAVCMEDIYKEYEEMEDVTKESIYGKFFIPTLTPFLDNNKPYDTYDHASGCTLSNYLDIRVPLLLFETVIKKDDLYIIDIKKGDIFTIFFLGGDINKPFITGRYEK